MQKIHIYRVYFPANGKCYIGQTCDVGRRMQEHLKSDSLVCRALWKYDKWEWMILHTCKTKDEANLIEIEEIRNFKSLAPGGYNLTSGGGGGDTFSGRHHTRATKKLLHDKQVGSKRPYVGDALRGKKQSPEHIEKRRILQIGSKHTEETKNKMSESAFKRTRRPFSEEAKKNMGKHCRGDGNPMKRPEVILKSRITCKKTAIERLMAELPPDVLGNLDELTKLL